MASARGLSAIWLPVFVAVACGSLFAAATQADIEKIINVDLRLPQGQAIQQEVFAVGFQIYNFNGTNWVLKNASSDLYDSVGKKVGHHFFLTKPDQNGGMATWETFEPRSRVTGKALISVAQEDAIAWILLKATSTEGDLKTLGSTKYVQRLFTKAGLAPTHPGKKGQTFKSAYTSLYTFAAPSSTH